MVDIRDDGRYDGLRKLKTVEIKQSDRTDTMTMSRDDIIAGLEKQNHQLCAALEKLINAATKEFGEVEQHYFGGDIKEALDAARNILDAKNK